MARLFGAARYAENANAPEKRREQRRGGKTLLRIKFARIVGKDFLSTASTRTATALTVMKTVARCVNP
jgi:hypothetical protein